MPHRSGIEPQPQLANARRVDQTTAVWKRDQLAGRGGVPALGVTGTNFRHRKLLLAEEPVRERGFSDPRRSEQDRRRAGFKPGHEEFEPIPADCGERQDVTERSTLTGLRDRGIQVRTQFDLGQDHHRLSASVPRQRRRPLDPAGIRPALDAFHDQHQVDVGRDHLFIVRLPRAPARQRSRPRQNGSDHMGALALVESHPITDGGRACLPRRLEGSRGDCGRHTRLRPDARGAAVDPSDARRNLFIVLKEPEERSEPIVPSVHFQSHCLSPVPVGVREHTLRRIGSVGYRVSGSERRTGGSTVQQPLR